MLLTAILLPWISALATTLADPGAPLPTRHALIVTNNRSLNTGRPDLQYADDDGVKYAELFAEEFGVAHVTLLAELDPVTRALYPDWQARVQPPTRQNLESAVSHLEQALGTAAARGEAAMVYLVFAGHGDVDHGQGYLELADSRLSARDLDEAVLAKLGNTPTHLVLDSCNSYFMLNPRKPGGKRFEVQPETQSLFDRYPNLGVLISTSAEAVTYEWSELQSGIFSYELRSGLRGAADVDHDRNVSYAELAAFIQTANAGVVNDAYRPKVFVRSPDRTAPFLRRSTPEPRLLTLAVTGALRLTLRDHQGVRVLDVHKEAGTALTLALPAGDLEIYETVVSSQGRPISSVRRYDANLHGEIRLEALSETPPATAARGESPVFTGLFKSPFGVEAFTLAQGSSAVVEPEYYGVTEKDAQVLRQHLVGATQADEDRRYSLTFGGLTGSLFAGIVLGPYVNSNKDMTRSERNWALAGGALIPAATLLGWGLGAWVDTPYEELLADYSAADQSTAEARGATVLKFRERFHTLANEERHDRRLHGAITSGIGLVIIGDSLAAALRDKNHVSPNTYTFLGVGAFVTLFGVLHATIDTQPAERMWELYETSESGTTAEPIAPPAEAKTSFNWMPNLGVAQGTAFIGVGGSF